MSGVFKAVLCNRRETTLGVSWNNFIRKCEQFSSLTQTLARLPLCIYVVLVTSALMLS